LDKKSIQDLDQLIPFSAKDPELIKMKHQRIVDCSCKIFFKKGFHPTTIRDIATACDMSMGQLYHYISSKDDVLFLVHKEMQKEMLKLKKLLIGVFLLKAILQKN